MLTPIKAIRAKCLDCSNDSFLEVKECAVNNCPLYPYRFGKRPKVDGITVTATKSKKVGSYLPTYEEEEVSEEVNENE